MPSSPLASIDWTASSLPLQDRKQARVLVRGIASITSMEGEVPWELPDTGTLRVLEYVDGSRTGSVEADIDDDGAAEPEFYLGQPIAAEAVRAIFNLPAESLTITRDHRKRTQLQSASSSLSNIDDSINTRARKSWGVVYLFSGLLLLLLAVMADSSGKMIFSETIDASRWAEQKLVGPIEFSKKGKIYEIRISGDVPYSSDAAWLSVELENPYEEVINVVESDMWSEGGESNKSASQIFELSESGIYYLRLDGEKSNLSFPATIQVYEDVVIARYFLIGGGILLFAAFLMLGKKNE